jgi:hypothetical protein
MAKGPSNKILRKNNPDNLLPAIGQAHRNLEYALDDIGDDNNVITLPKYSLALENLLPSAQPTQKLKLVGFEPGANCTVTYNALGAIFHMFSVAQAAKCGNRSKRDFA